MYIKDLKKQVETALFPTSLLKYSGCVLRMSQEEILLLMDKCTDLQCKILNCLLSLLRRYKWVYPAQGTIAEEVGCSRGYVNRVIAMFESWGLFFSEQTGDWSNFYYFSNAFNDPLFCARLSKYLSVSIVLPVVCLRAEVTLLSYNEYKYAETHCPPSTYFHPKPDQESHKRESVESYQQQASRFKRKVRKKRIANYSSEPKFGYDTYRERNSDHEIVELIARYVPKESTNGI